MNILKASWGVIVLVVLMFSSMAQAEPGALYHLKPTDVDQSWVMVKGLPGMQVSEEFVLVNQSEYPATFDLVLLDASRTDESDGYFALKNTDEAATGVGLWATLSANQVFVEANSSVTVTVDVSIPAEAEVGSYWGGILAMEVPEETAPAEVTAEVTVEEEGGIVSLIQNGLRVNVEVMSAEEYAAWLSGKSKEAEKVERGGGFPSAAAAGGIVLVSALALAVWNKGRR